MIGDRQALDEATSSRRWPTTDSVILADHVKWCCIDDAVFILDTRSGHYHALPPESASPWLIRFADAEPGSRARGEPEGAAAVNLLRALRQRGWIAAAEDVERQPPRRLRWNLRCRGLDAFHCLVRSAWTLRLGGFHAAYAWAKSNARPIDSPGAPAAPGTVAAAVATFHRAERFVLSHRGLDDCLPRSLALFVYLRRCGFAVRHLIGVKRYPFAAHAWVEHGTHVLLQAQRHGGAPWPAGADRHEFVPIAEIA